MRIALTLHCRFCGRSFTINVQHIPDTATCTHCHEEHVL